MSNQESKPTSSSSPISGIKKGFLSSIASCKEGMVYVKAFFVSQGKKLTARNEKDAMAADMQEAKMQVEAADAAEETKERLRKT